MKTLLYFENENALKKSGIGRALRHQMKALSTNDVEFTLNKKDDFDIAHINTYFLRSQKLLKKCHKKGKKVVVHGHSTFEDFRKSFRLYKLMEPAFDNMLKRMYSKADVIITPTPYSKKLIENYPFIKCPVYAISNGIDLDEYSYKEEKVKKFKEYFNIKENDKVVMGVGLFFERKGILDFFEIARKMPDVKFIWFGNLARILVPLKILRAIKNRPNNVIMPGYIDGDIIKGAYLASNLVLFPSFEETEGIVALEALASKTPLLVRDIGVFDPWLVDNKNCLKAKTNEEFIKKINYALNNDLSAIVEEGYKVAKEREISRVGKQIKEVYKTLLD